MSKYEKLKDMISFEIATINSFKKAYLLLLKNDESELDDFEEGFIQGMESIRNDLFEILGEAENGENNISDKSDKFSDSHIS